MHLSVGRVSDVLDPENYVPVAVLLVYQDEPVDRVRVGDVIDEIAFALVELSLTKVRKAKNKPK